MLKLSALNLGYGGQEVIFLGSTGQGILHAYKNYNGELVILFCNSRVEKSWYHVSNKIALKAWHRARRITKVNITYADFVKRFGEIRDAYNVKKVFEEKGFMCTKKYDAIFVYKDSEYVKSVENKLVPINECMKVGLHYVPLNALDEWTFVCDVCGERHMKDNKADVHMEGGEIKFMCRSCRAEKAFKCRDCNEWYENSLQSDEDSRICKSCFDTYYTTCPKCGSVFRRDRGYDLDGELICRTCRDEIEIKVRGYHDNPELNFLGNGNMFIGTEIETVGNNSSDYFHRIMFTHEFGDEESTLYQMHDGSLSDYGIENITMPMSKDYFDLFDFEGWFTGLVNRGATTDDSCGLHVHLSRAWMGTDVREEQDLLVGRMRQFLADNKDNVQAYARRTNERWCSYRKSFEKYMKPATKEERANRHKSNAKYRDRYASVNNMNSATIEFRIFAGTLDARKYRAAVEFCLRVVDYIVTHEENTETWEEFINYKPLPESMKIYMESIGLPTAYAIQPEIQFVEQ